MNEFLEGNGGWLAGISAALVAAAASVRQFSKTLASDKLESVKLKAETDVVDLLRTEWVRAIANNQALSEQVTRLNAEWDKTIQSNRALAEQVEQLHDLINELRAEIVILKQKVQGGS